MNYKPITLSSFFLFFIIIIVLASPFPSSYAATNVTIVESYVARERCDISEITYIGYRMVFTSDNSPLKYVKVTFQETSGQYYTNHQGWVILPVFSNEIAKKSWKIDEVSFGNEQFVIDQVVSDPEVIFDEVIIALDPSQTRVSIGSNQSIVYSGYYAYDETRYTGEVMFNENYIYSDQIGEKEYYVTSINDDVYGITLYQTNTINVIFDQVKIHLDVVDDRIDIGSSADISVINATYLYDGREFDGDIYFTRNLIQNDVGKYTYTVSSITDNQYRVSIFECNSVEVIFDKVDVTLSVEDARINIGETARIEFEGTYLYDGQMFEGSAEFNNDDHQYDAVGSKRYSVIKIDDPLYQLTEFSSNEIEVIWDRVNIELDADSDRINVGETVSIAWHGTYEYDGITFSQDNEVILNSDQFMRRSVGDLSFIVREINDGFYDITEFKSESCTVIWDRINVRIDFPKKRIEAGTEAEPSIFAEYEYNDAPFRGRVNLDNSLEHDEVGPQVYTVSSIEDPLYDLEVFTSNDAQIIFDRISVTEETKGDTPGSLEATFNPVYESDGKVVQDVQIVGNGKEAIPIGVGRYQIRLPNWGLNLRLDTEISVDGFSTITLSTDVTCYGNIGAYSAVGLLILTGVALSLPTLLFASRINSLARQDYNRSRGTIHKNLLKHCLGNLRNEMKKLEIKLISLKNQKHMVSTQKNDEVRSTRRRSAASSSARKKRIEQFGKQEDEYSGHILEAQGRLDYLVNLEAQAVFHMNRLENVTPSMFTRSYKGVDIASEESTKYMLGIFPEWTRTPEWFKSLTENYQHGRGTKNGF